MSRIVPLLPIVVCAIALGKATDAAPLAVALAGLATVAAIAGPRWELDRGRQVVTSAMGAAAAYAIVATLYAWRAPLLGEGWTRIAAMALLAAAARFVIVRALGGWRVTTALAFASLVAVGETRVGGYVVFVILFLVTSLAARQREEPRTPKGMTSARAGVGGAILLAAAAMAIGATATMRLGYAWMTRRGHSNALTWTPRVGFSDQMDLGALDGLLDSDTVVLRVRGRRVDYLRGAALDSYAAGRWTRSDAVDVPTPAAFDGEVPARDGVEIAAVSDRTDRFFLPLEARAIVTSPQSVLVDPLGAIKRVAKHGVNAARFVVGDRDRASVAPPTASDLQLPRRIRPALERLAAQWTAGATTTAQKLDAIERTMRTDFHYSRTFRPAAGTDPALDFLLRVKSGHCEYFATGMALVARAAGIPTRVVAGYRVAERSPFGYYVVRERNAHAWVEAWLPEGHWATRDATPGEALPQNVEHQGGYAASLVDALGVAYGEVTDRLARLSVAHTAAAAGGGFVVLLWVVARGARRRDGPGRRSAEGETAPAGLAILLAALEQAGHPHPAHEPLERLAARLADPQPARLLERYAALRYGNVGDGDALDADVRAYARR